MAAGTKVEAAAGGGMHAPTLYTSASILDVQNVTKKKKTKRVGPAIQPSHATDLGRPRTPTNSGNMREQCPTHPCRKARAGSRQASVRSATPAPTTAQKMWQMEVNRVPAGSGRQQR